jgi:long-chain acyl-CoA synthetase
LHSGDLSWPLERGARQYAGKIAVRDGGRSVAYGELHRRVRALGGGLEALGSAPGDRVGYLGVNSSAHLECVLGVPAHGRVLTDLNFRLSLEELAFMVDDAEVGVLVVDQSQLEVGRRLRDRCEALDVLVLAHGPDEADCVSYEELVAGEPLPRRTIAGDEPAAISFTGGTTGKPKGVVLSHRNLLANAQHNLVATGHRPDDVFLHCCPMFHAAGVANIFAAAWVGAEHVVIPRFDPAMAVAAIERHGVTHAILVPTMLGMLLDHLETSPGDLSSLRNLQYAASPISPDLQRRAVEALDCELAQFYGLTEAAPTVSHLSPEDHARGVAGEEPQRTRLASIGVPVPGVEAEVRHEDGRPAATGATGELWVRGPNVMTGYWNRPEASAEALVDGWLRTGDVARTDDDGYLYLVDRVKDVIVTGGENVFSVEVERALQTHPAVREAAVFGVPDPRWGEAVHAVIVVDPDHEFATDVEGAIVEHCRERIAGFKVPRSLELRSEPLPTSGAGKVLKAELREPHWAGRERRVG